MHFSLCALQGKVALAAGRQWYSEAERKKFLILSVKTPKAWASAQGLTSGRGSAS